MAKIDNRSMDHKVLEHVRLLAVERVLSGEKPSVVAKSFGLYRTSIYKWLRAQRKRGRDALKSTTAQGPTPKLTEGQKKQVRRWIVGKDPRQYGFDFGLWTRSIIAEMIQDKFDVALTLPSIGRLLTSLDTTPQKPLRRAYERDEKEIRRWKDEKYPDLRKRCCVGKATDGSKLLRPRQRRAVEALLNVKGKCAAPFHRGRSRGGTVARVSRKFQGSHRSGCALTSLG